MPLHPPRLRRGPAPHRARPALAARLAFAAGLSLLTAAAGAPAWAQGVGEPGARPDPAAVARRLATLRTEAGRLDDELRALRAEGLAEVRGLADQKARLEAQLATEAARRAEAEARRAASEAEAQQQSDADAAVRAAVDSGLVALRGAVATSLPFRRAERLAALDDLAAGLAGGRLSAVEVAARLWRFAEDELRLTGEIAPATAPVTVAPGEVRLLEAVRVGLVALYTRDPQGGMGALLRDAPPGEAHPDGWAWRPVTAPDQVEALQRLFTDRSRQIHTGTYWLPLPPPRTHVGREVGP